MGGTANTSALGASTVGLRWDGLVRVPLPPAAASDSFNVGSHAASLSGAASRRSQEYDSYQGLTSLPLKNDMEVIDTRAHRAAAARPLSLSLRPLPS